MADKVEIDVLINTAETSNNIRELRKTIRELSGAAEAIGDRGSKEFQRIAKVIGDTQDKLEDLKEDLTAFKGSAVERFNAGIQVMKERLANLDLKGVGDSFKNLGNIIKANPIGIFVALIAELIANFDKLKAAGGFIGSLFTGIGNAIDFVVGGLESFANAIGLIDTKTAEHSKNVVENLDKQLQAYDEYYKKIEELQNASGTNSLLAERNNAEARMKQDRALVDELIKIRRGYEKELGRSALYGKQVQIIAGRELTEEEQKRLNDLLERIRKNAFEIRKIDKRLEAEQRKAADELEKEEKERQKRLLDAYERLVKKGADLNKLLLDALAKGDIKKANQVADQFNNISAEIKGINDEAELLTKNIPLIRRGFDESIFKKVPDGLQQIKNTTEETNTAITATANSFGENFLAGVQNVNDFLKSDLGQGLKQTFDSLAALGTAISSSIQEAAEQQRDAQIKALDEFDAYEQKRNEDRLARKEITEAQFAQIENTARIKSEQRRKEIEKAAFEKFRRAKRAEIAINLATELSAIAASAAANPANAVTFGAAGAAQAAALTAAALIKAGSAYNSIDAQKPYRKGGILQGASHERGGIPTPYGELEGGEAVINTKSTSMFKPLLSAINEAGGGRRFAMGGVLSQQEQINQIQQAVTAVQTPVIKTYVLQSDVADANRQVERISRRNTI